MQEQLVKIVRLERSKGEFINEPIDANVEVVSEFSKLDPMSLENQLVQATASWIAGKPNCLNDLIAQATAVSQKRHAERFAQKRAIESPAKCDNVLSDVATLKSPNHAIKPPRKHKKEHSEALVAEGGRQTIKI